MRLTDTRDKTASAITFNDVIESTGYIGKYQIIQSVFLLLSTFVVAFPILNIVFLGYVVPHHCREGNSTNDDDDDNFGVNATSIEYGECQIVVTTNGSEGEEVKKTYACLYGHAYSLPRKISIVSEWDLVCDQEGYTELSQTVLSVGQMVGAVLCTSLADKLGRKPLYVSCLLGLTACGFGTSFSPSIVVFVVLRFFIGLLQQGCGLSSYTMFVELLPTYHRTLAGMVGGIVWVSSLSMLSLLAYLMEDFNWRHAQLVYASVSVYVIVLYCTIDESVRWLLANGKLDEARRLISKAARVNKSDPREVLRVLDSLIADQTDIIPCSDLTDAELEKPLILDAKTTFSVEVDEHRSLCEHKRSRVTDTDTGSGDTSNPTVCVECLSDKIDGLELNSLHKPLMTSEHRQEESHLKNSTPPRDERETTPAAPHGIYRKSIHYTVLDLFRSRTILRVTLIIFYIWIVNSLTYYGIFLTSSSLVGNRFLNFFLSAIVELPAAVIVQILYTRTGRKQVSILFHTLAGIFLITSVTILGTAGNSEAGKIASNVFNLLGKFAISASFGALFVYSPEVFPTNLRTAGIGISSSSARIGGMIAPYSRILSRKFIWGPGALFGVMCLVAAFLVTYLPETKGRELPTTIEEMEKSIVETAGMSKTWNKKGVHREQK